MERTQKVRVEHKSDGGFWIALASFLLMLFYFVVRSNFGKQYFGDSIGFKFTLVLIVFALSWYASYRKVRHPDHSSGFFGRPYARDVFIWFARIFSIPAIIIYAILLISGNR